MAAVNIIVFLLSLVLVLIFTPIIYKVSLRIGVFKRIQTTQAQPEHIPYLGGLGVFFAYFIIVLFFLLRHERLSHEFLGIAIGSAIIVCLGLVDDFIELSPVWKFFGQGLATFALIKFGVVTKIAALPALINVLITFFWMFAIINALNLLDIMDGLCSGICVIASGAFLIICLLNKNIQAAIICSSLLGVSLGFLRYNLPQARIYLGDTGSMFLGFTLATIAIIVDYAPLERKIALLTPIIVLGLPIFDTTFVILMRILRGRAVLRKSKDHFALRLLRAGLSKQKALLLMYAFGLFFAVSALIISQVPNQIGILVLLAIILVCAVALRKIGSINVTD